MIESFSSSASKKRRFRGGNFSHQDAFESNSSFTNDIDNQDQRDVAMAVSILTSELDSYENVSDLLGVLNFPNAYSVNNQDFADFDAADMALVQILAEIPSIDLAQHNLNNESSNIQLNDPIFMNGNNIYNNVKLKTDSWNEMFLRLTQYGNINGHCNVPKRYVICDLNQEEKKLGQWVYDQRKSYYKSKLLPHRRLLIQDLIDKGMLNWELNSKEESSESRWNVYFEALLQYGENKGDYNVPRDYKVEIEISNTTKNISKITLNLGNWLHKQRSNNTLNKLSREKKLLLQGLVDRGMLLWNVRNDFDSYRWETIYNSLVDYADRNSNCNIDPNQNFNLMNGSTCRIGLWLNNQKCLQRKGMLKPERQAKLQVLVDQGKMHWFKIIKSRKIAKTKDTENI
jgi:hypothetical protein